MTLNNDLFVLVRKNDQVVLQMLREAKDVDDLQDFFTALHNLFVVNPKDTRKLSVFVDCSRIILSPIRVNFTVLKAIYDFLVVNAPIVSSRVSLCGILISSRLLSITVSKLLSNFELEGVKLDLFYERAKCMDFLKNERLKEL
jgi:hypothetical protein